MAAAVTDRQEGVVGAFVEADCRSCDRAGKGHLRAIRRADADHLALEVFRLLEFAVVVDEQAEHRLRIEVVEDFTSTPRARAPSVGPGPGAPICACPADIACMQADEPSTASSVGVRPSSPK